MTTTVTDSELYARLRKVIQREWISIPDSPGSRGTGAPGIILEEQLGIRGGNLDTPNAGKWEIKFHGGSALLTLFHLEAEPLCHMHDMVHKFGQVDSKGYTSFRHTIKGKTDKGFYVVNDSGRIIVCNDRASDFKPPYWTHDHLINAFVSKLRRLIVVKGEKRKKENIWKVRYISAHLFQEPKTTRFIEDIVGGIVAVEFNARTTDGKGLRNHGTRFRIKYENLRDLYHNQRELD